MINVGIPSAPTPARRFRAALLLGAGVCAGACGAALWKHDPRVSAFFPPCPFHALTGLHCPGCGSTRALHALVHGDLIAAVHSNPLLVATLPFLAVLASGQYIWPSVGGHWLTAIPARWIWTYFAVVVVFWIARNIPQYPFTLLAPH